MAKKKLTEMEKREAWVEFRMKTMYEIASVLLILVLMTLMAIPIVAAGIGAGGESAFFGAVLNTTLLYGLVAANFVNFIMR